MKFNILLKKTNCLKYVFLLCCLMLLKHSFLSGLKILEDDALLFKEAKSGWEEFERDMKTRRDVMKRGCRKYGLDERKNDSLHQPYAWEYLIAKHDGVNLVWCNIFKSASSSWMYLFNRLAGYTEKELQDTVSKPLIALAREKYARPSTVELLETLALINTIGFLIARNPYERLVSGYRDKILGEAVRYPSAVYGQISRIILKKYRLKDPYGSSKSSTPTFTEFIRYIVDEVAKGRQLDMHWTPAYKFCNPCQVDLTHIIKFETIDRDTSWIVEKANLTSFMPLTRRPNQENKLKKNAAKDGKNTSSIVDTYLQNLPQDMLNDLNDIYEIDFDIFGYQLVKSFRNV